MDTPATKLIAPNLYPAPTWFPQAFDKTRQWVRMMRFDEPDYRAAPFLDLRGIRQGMPFGIVPFSLLAEQTPSDARRDAHWIFHISHVGSTLVSRLLGELDGVLAYREPLLLRDLAAMPGDEAAACIPVLRALLSRAFRTDQRAIVKATSYVSEFADALVGPASDGGKAVMIGMAPERFIAARLVGPRDELRGGAAKRLARLVRRIPALDQTDATVDDARLAALGWAAECMALEAAASAIGPERVVWLDFDSFLADPLAGITTLAAHFDLAARPAALKSIVEGPLMTRYSKNSSRAFDRTERERGIEEHLVGARGEIGAAMRWLETTATGAPLLAAALNRGAR